MKETYLKGFFPTPRDQWLTWLERANICFHAGDHWQDPEVLEEAVAVATAECGGDPNAYLAYIDFEYPHIWAKLARKYRLKTMSNRYPLAELRKVLPKWATVAAADRGMFQMSSRWQPDATDDVVFDPVYNAKRAYRIWLGRSRTFSAWMAWTGGHHVKYLPYAEIAVQGLVNGLLKGSIEPIKDDYEIELRFPSVGANAQTIPYAKRYGRRWGKHDWETFRDALRRHRSSWRIWARRRRKLAAEVFPGRSIP